MTDTTEMTPPKESIVALARLLELLEEAVSCAVRTTLNDFCGRTPTAIATAINATADNDDSVFYSLMDNLILVQKSLIYRLAYGGLLIDCEYRDECGTLVGIVNKINTDEKPPFVCFDRDRGEHPTGGEDLEAVCRGYFCLPGSNARNWAALVELARARVNQIADVAA